MLEIDASHARLGAVLSQEQERLQRPFAHASQSLHPAERNMSNYSAMKLELLIEKFCEYFLGVKFVVFIDNTPLSYLQTEKLAVVEQHWVSQLALFDFFCLVGQHI